MARFEFQKRLFTVAPEDIIEIFVDARHMSITARPYGGRDVRIEYYSCDEYPYSARVSDGIVILDCPQEPRGGLSGMFGMIMNQVNPMSWQDMPINIYLPSDFGGMLNLCTSHARIAASNLELSSRFHALASNAAIELRGVLATAFDLKTSNARIVLENVAALGEPDEQGAPRPALSRITSSNGALNLTALSTMGALECSTSNGALRLSDVAVQGALNCTSSNGAARISDVSVQETATIRTSNASISLERLLARDIVLRTNNGSIKGSVVGRASDFAVDSRTSNGRSNLPASSYGARKLSAHTSNANISVSFVE